jgi:hypothetical protein
MKKKSLIIKNKIHHKKAEKNLWRNHRENDEAI